MPAITKFDPVDNNLDEILKGFLLRPVRFELDAVPEVRIKLDMTENGDVYNVFAELPGVKKDDIHVTVDGSVVSISAEVRRNEQSDNSARVLRSERHYGKIDRWFTLASEVDLAKSEACFSDGVLKLRLVKKGTIRSGTLQIA